ncbi:hypothetical protein [Fluviispira vulneris]|uniref:hypothetical protein n=1 Tax=Fluviispira vulneris TaxID=2763012 RepID=UPI0016479DAF|nr:hypothetical protein [Fluviispira vulneris]
MPQISFYVPAKAMLFGEYGVLYSGRAIALTFYQHTFHIDIHLQPTQSDGKVTVKSSFFTENPLEFKLTESLNSKDNRDLNFFKNLLFPWKQNLQNKDLQIEIKNSFNPDLGFGSSSALIAGISKGLWLLLFNEKDFMNNEEFWKAVRESLNCIQGSGSCYDVAVQLAASQENIPFDKTQLWLFQNRQESSIPIIENFTLSDSIENYGFFIKTRVYSDTSKIVKGFQSQENREKHASEHALLADKFIEDSSLLNTIYLMKMSLEIAQRQNLLPRNNLNLNILLDKLNDMQIPYKTMGAGHGDCLWVLYDKNKFIKDFKINDSDIPFAFTTNGQAK